MRFQEVETNALSRSCNKSAFNTRGQLDVFNLHLLRLTGTGRPPTGVVLRGGAPCCPKLLGARSNIGLGLDVDTLTAGDTRTPAM